MRRRKQNGREAEALRTGFEQIPRLTFRTARSTPPPAVIEDVSFCTDSSAPPDPSSAQFPMRAESALINGNVFQRMIWALIGLTLIALSFVVGLT